MHRLIRTTFVTLVVLAGSSLSTAWAASQIRAIVNGDVVTSYDVAQRARLLPLFGQKGGEKAAMEELVDETLKLQEAKRLGLNIPDKQVDAAFASIGQDKKLNPTQLARELGRIGIEASTMKRWIKAQMTWRQLVQARVRREGQVKTSDIMAAMLEKKGSPDSITVSEYTLQQIIFVVPKGSSDALVAQRRREAESFRQRFAGCEGSLQQAKNLKGVVVKDLGRRDSSQLSGAQGDEIKGLEPGKTTRPLPGANGVELIAVCAKRDFQSNAAARTEVETQLKLAQAKEMGEEYLAKLRKTAIIKYR